MTDTVENSGHTAPAPRGELTADDIAFIGDLISGFDHFGTGNGENVARDEARAQATWQRILAALTPAPQPQPLPSQPAERDDRRAEVEADARQAVLFTLSEWCPGRQPDELEEMLADILAALGGHRLKELERALEPFAEIADSMDRQGNYVTPGVAIRHYYAARQALKGEHA